MEQGCGGFEFWSQWLGVWGVQLAGWLATLDDAYTLLRWLFDTYTRSTCTFPPGCCGWSGLEMEQLIAVSAIGWRMDADQSVGLDDAPSSLSFL